MPVNKPTISHQLKTVSHSKPSSSFIRSPFNSLAHQSSSRSHLRGSSVKHTGTRIHEHITDKTGVSTEDWKQYTKLLQTVLRDGDDKSTSTDDFYCYEVIKKRKSVDPLKSLYSNSDQISVDNYSKKFEDPNDKTEADLLSLETNEKPILSLRQKVTQFPDDKPIYCSCDTDMSKVAIGDSKCLGDSDDWQKCKENVNICFKCHNIIASVENGSPVSITKTSKENMSSSSETFKSKFPQTPIVTGQSRFSYDFPLDNVSVLLDLVQTKIMDVRSIALATRDADLDRIICELDQAFQKVVRGNTYAFSRMETIAKTLKSENSTLKQKIKSQSEVNRDLKTELKLVRQDHKQKFEELKLELQLKSEEIKEMNNRDKNNLTYWKDKYQSLEREFEKLRSDYQGQVLQACQKDTEIIQLKHNCSQSELQMKEQVHSLNLKNQNLQKEMQILQSQYKKYEQDLQHNQLIIKTAREQIVNLLDRHKLNSNSFISGSFHLENSKDASPNGDWINQAANLHQVLSMVSNEKDKSPSDVLPVKEKSSNVTNSNSTNSPLSECYKSMSVSPINFASTNYNNNHLSFDCNLLGSTSTIEICKSTSNSLKCDSELLNGHDNSVKSVSNLSSNLSQLSHELSGTSDEEQPDNTYNEINNFNNPSRRGLIKQDGLDLDLRNFGHMINMKRNPSASSVRSTISSLKSADDWEFQSGLKRLDSQISKLQNTLKSKLQCK